MITASFLTERAANIPAGVHTAVKFTGITKDGTWTDINFSDSERRSAKKRLFKPEGKMLRDITEGENTRKETLKEALEREELNNMQIMANVLEAVLSAEDFEAFKAENYNAFMTKAETDLNKHKNALVNLKVISKSIKNKDTGKTSVIADIQNYPGFVQKYVEGVPATFSFSKKEQEAMTPKEEKIDKGDDIPF